MAESQLLCMDDEHVNEKIPESRPEFYYSEEQRAALEQLLRSGDGAFKMRLREDNAKDFLSAREIKRIRKTFHEYDTPDRHGDCEPGEHDKSKESSCADSGVHSTYWPQMSDTEVPSLDIGWPGSSGFYKGVTRVSVYTHPPKEGGPHIKQVVRRLIQESHKVVAIVMDLLTDLQILQDLLDASSRRGVAVYTVLEVGGVPHFLDMCTRLQINATHLRNLRVRTVKGAGLALSFGKLPGSLCSKYMLVDGDKVMFGSYSFTWSSSRMDRNMITLMSGQIVDFFDNDFRETYAVSEQVDLYREFNITKPPIPSPVKKPTVEKIQPLPVSTSRFQVSLGDSKQADMKVPAHKYHNPKYSLVVGNNLSRTCSLQDLSTRDSVVDGLSQWKGLPKKPSLPTNEDSGEKAPASLAEEEGKGGLKKLPGLSGRKSSFRLFLKGRGTNQSTETIEEGTASTQSPSSTRKVPETLRKIPETIRKIPETIRKIPDTNRKVPETTYKVPETTHKVPETTHKVPETTLKVAEANHKVPETTHKVPEANHKVPEANRKVPEANHKVPETNNVEEDDFDDLCEIEEKESPLVKFKSKKPAKLLQRSMSLMTINTGDEDGFKNRRRNQKKKCIQS